MKIDMWYGDDVNKVDAVSCSFSDCDCVYRGWMYIGGKIVGDYSTKDSLEIEKTFNVRFSN